MRLSLSIIFLFAALAASSANAQQITSPPNSDLTPLNAILIYGTSGNANLGDLELRASKFTEDMFNPGVADWVEMGTQPVNPPYVDPWGGVTPGDWYSVVGINQYPFFATLWGCPNTGYQVGFVGDFKFELLLNGQVVSTTYHFYWYDCVYN